METAATTTPVDEDRPCLRCGYSLRGLARDGVCPECGTAVERSLRGNLLLYSSPEYLAKLHLGAFIAELAVILMLLVVVGGVAVRATMPAGPVSELVFALLAAVPLAFSAATLGGWWLLSAPDPAFVGQDSGDRSRRVLRGALIAVLAMMLLWQGVSLMGMGTGLLRAVPRGRAGWLGSVAGLGSVLAWTAALVASMYYLRALSTRMGDATVRAAAMGVVWCVGIAAGLILAPILAAVAGLARGFGSPIGISGCIGMVVVIVTFVLYGNLLHLVRVQLGRIRVDARRMQVKGAGTAVASPGPAESR